VLEPTASQEVMKMNSISRRSLRAVSIAIMVFCASTASIFAQNPWTRKADFGGLPRPSAVGFSIGEKGYIGPGNYYRDFWEYNPSTNSWTQKADFSGSARFGAVGFSIGEKGYIGTGYSYGSTTRDFWEYDPATNRWTQKADFGGSARYNSVGLSIGSKGYIGLGHPVSTMYFRDFWEYDPSTDSWTQKADFVGSMRWLAVGFSIGDKGYIGTGADARGVSTREFWQYDPTTDTWNRQADFGGVERVYATGFSIADNGYIGTGSGLRDFWEYDPLSNTWTQKADFGGTGRGGATGFSVGEKGYIGLGDGQSDFWEYDPKKLLPDQVQLLYPADTDTIKLESDVPEVVFLWQQSFVATHYGFELSTDSSFIRLIFQDSAMIGTSYLWEVPKENKTYWWRVRAGNEYGWGGKGLPRSFTCIFDSSQSIDIMVVYTAAAESLANSYGGINLVIAQDMIIGQQVLDNSHAHTSIRLVHIAKVDYEDWSSPDVLLRLTDPNDGYMDEVHRWRVTYGADLVVLLGPGGGGGGQAWLLTDTSGAPSLGFSLAGGISPGYAFIHEVGHNMGCHHSRCQASAAAPASGGLFVYSTGWRWKETDGKGYCDVMTYPAADELQVPIFSNPDILWEGTPCGSYDLNDPCAPADNARTIREIKNVIAGYSSSLTASAVADKGNVMTTPDRFVLNQNYPNPFNPSTSIEYEMPQRTFVNLSVYDILGQKVAELVSQYQSAGRHKVDFRSGNFSSGIYFYRLNAGSLVDTKRMLLLR
jgi:N-acetylneuraminic acid mutarotase